MRRVEGGKWQPIWIEFEYESRNFMKHMHDVKGCDLIVCWEHNWPDCPIEVIELRAWWDTKILSQIYADERRFNQHRTPRAASLCRAYGVWYLNTLLHGVAVG